MNAGQFAQLLNPKGYAKEHAKKKQKTQNNGPQQSRKPATPSQSSAQAAVPSYDPKVLLNPKTPAGGSNRAADNATDEDPSNGDFGAGSMIEKLNGITSREDVPATKRKAQAMEDADEDEERKKLKSRFLGQGSAGTVGDHMKEERTKMAGPAETIDLTNEEDDVQIVRANDSGREVCLGNIKSSANVHRIPHPGGKSMGSKSVWGPWRASIHEQDIGPSNKIDLYDRQGNKFGMVEPKMGSAMVAILRGAAMNKCRFKILVPMRPKRTDEYVGKNVSQSIKIEVAVLAPFNKADQLGRFFSQKQLFLSTPHLEPGREIFNPQDPKNYGQAKTTAAAVKPQYAPSVQRTAEDIRREASSMFDQLDKTGKQELEMAANSSIITSELMSHQKQALHFLTQHERDDFDETESPYTLWKFKAKNNGQHAWYNIITGTEVYKKPKPLQGGILADVMGLGKTLSILSLIAETRQTAVSFRHRDVPDDVDAEANAQGTLIICPKSVLSNWQEQIRNHTKSLKVYTYHGSTRTQDLELLAKHDIVLTSYNTAATEFGAGIKKNTALADINWFRIVLDEAHSIRNQTTQVSKACCSLNAERRWAVTGTPVQNNLSDLGALVRFIRLQPFEQPTVWSQHIMAPFKLGDTDVIEKLQVLVASITLRRSKNTIKLPDRSEVRETLEFSKDEALLYRQFASKSRSQFQQVSSNGNALRGKAYAHVLKSLGRLRAICAHGPEMLSEEDMKEIEGHDQSNAIVIDIGDEQDSEEEFLTEKQAYDHFIMTQDSEVDQCTSCMAKLSVEKVRADGAVDLTAEDDDSSKSSGDSDTEDEVDDSQDLLGHITTCYHLICAKCTDKHTAEVKAQLSVDHHYECQYCGTWQPYGMCPILRSRLKQFKEERQGRSKKGKIARWDDSTYSGPHTKVKALLEDLRKSAEETEQLPEGEPPIRSVVFSGWTAYLDLIEFALTKNNIGFARIDGSMSVKERSKNLALFNTVPEVTVLLVSIKAGGQGLNFTAANKAYVMEPQFNPGVEAQAVDRVHRIGQTRNVVIKHYIMRNSVEEGILKLQQKKEKLAQMSMERKKNKSEEAKQRMEELKDLFK